MKEASIDIFPDGDSFCYAEDGVACEKHYPMEHHLCNCLALYSLSHQYAWSKWNMTAGSRVVIMLVRDIIGKTHYPQFRTLSVTPLKSNIIDVSEESEKFSDTPLIETGFYPDFIQLAQDIASPHARKKANETPPDMVTNMADFLMGTRILSYS